MGNRVTFSIKIVKERKLSIQTILMTIVMHIPTEPFKIPKDPNQLQFPIANLTQIDNCTSKEINLREK